METEHSATDYIQIRKDGFVNPASLVHTLLTQRHITYEAAIIHTYITLEKNRALQNPTHRYSIFTYPSPWWESSFNKRIQLQFSLNCLPGEPHKLRVQHRSHSARNCTKLEFLLSQSQRCDGEDDRSIFEWVSSPSRGRAAQRLALCTLEETTSTRQVPPKN